MFRDQEFSADMNSRGVKRIGDVAISARVAVPAGRGPDGASDPPIELHEDRQLLHRDRVREGRGGDSSVPHVVG